MTIHANAKTGAHHHGHLESVIYIVKGRARMRWGRPSRVHGGGRVGRLHLRALLRSAPGDQRQPDRGTGVRAVPQRWRGGRGEPGHRACRKAGAGAVDRSHASQGRRLGNKTSRAINPIRDTAKIPEAGDEGGGGGGGGDSEDSRSDGGDSNLDLS